MTSEDFIASVAAIVLSVTAAVVGVDAYNNHLENKRDEELSEEFDDFRSKVRQGGIERTFYISKHNFIPSVEREYNVFDRMEVLYRIQLAKVYDERK